MFSLISRQFSSQLAIHNFTEIPMCRLGFQFLPNMDCFQCTNIVVTSALLWWPGENFQPLRMRTKPSHLNANGRAWDYVQLLNIMQGIPQSQQFPTHWDDFEMEDTHRGRVFNHWVKKTSKFLSPGRVKNQEFLSGFPQNSTFEQLISPGFSKIFGFCLG